MLKPRSSARVMLAVLLSGTMWYVSAGINHVWIAAWLAPFPILVVLLDLPAAHAAMAAFIASTIGALSFVVAYRGLPPLLLASVVLLFAVPFTCVVSLWRAIALQARPDVAVVAYPGLVVSAEYLISLVSPHGTFGSLAYSQADVPIILQLASVTGLWGISFLMSLVPAALTIAWRHRQEHKIAGRVLMVGILPLGLAVAFGAVRLIRPMPATHVRVGLAVSDVGAGRHFATQDPVEALSVVRANANRAAALAKGGVQFVVLPEKFVGITPEYADRALAILSEVARDAHVTVVAGFNFLSLPERRNLAVVFGPGGQVVLEYDKQHFVPGLEEGYRRGKVIGLVPGAAVATGVAICKDL
ncbi:MAG TPA: nitrilase-related carbon-nitrogen hydrolase, partial [Terriglobia bacterium]|nr:nitrilase-related carbon-nitrogen hydrolase [Terriglobia bacterium]